MRCYIRLANLVEANCNTLAHLVPQVCGVLDCMHIPIFPPMDGWINSVISVNISSIDIQFMC